MKEELTTKMHSEFTVSEETDSKLRALSLLQMERDGLKITNKRLENEGLTVDQLEEYRREYAVLLSK